MSNEPKHTAFYRPDLTVGTIIGITNQPSGTDGAVTPGGDAQPDQRMLVDYLPSDSHQYAYQIPVVLPFGLARRPRRGQFVAVHYAMGSPQYGYVHGHSFNNDTAVQYADRYPMLGLVSGGLPGLNGSAGTLDASGGDSPYADNTGNIIPNADDLALYHDETGAFWRFRSLQGASPQQAGVLGGPAVVELRMRSGALFAFQEYPPDTQAQPPPSPPGSSPAPAQAAATRAKLTLTMPAGTSIAYDEPQQGVGTLSVSLPGNNGNTTLVIDQDGKVTLTATNDVKLDASGQTVEIDAQTINLGSSGLSDDQEVVRKSDLQTGLNELAKLCQPGNGVPPPTALASGTVYAAD